MKKVLLSPLAAFLIMSTGVSAFAATSTNYDVAVELARAKSVDGLVGRINSLAQRTNQYILNTGDLSITLGEINTFFGITNNSIWKNYSAGVLNIANLGDNYARISNVFTITPSTTVKKLYASSANLPALNIISGSKDEIIDIPYAPVTFQFIKAVRKIGSSASIQPTAPADHSKPWYKPDGQGGFSIYQWKNGAWNFIGTLGGGTGNGGTGNGGNSTIVVSSISALNTLPASSGMKAMVSNGTTAAGYVFDGAKWVKTSTAGSGNGGMFDGLGSIHDMATTLFAKTGGSKVTASAISGEWAGSKQFTKKDDTATGGYWMSTDGNFIVTKSFDNLIKLNNYFHLGMTAWIDDGANGVYKLKKMSIHGYGTHWAFQAANYGDVLNLEAAYALVAPSNTSEIVYVENHNVFETYNPAQHVFKPLTGKIYISKSNNGRNAFYASSGKIYLLQNNDCTSSTCNGTSANNYYAGAKTDGLYTFYYATTGKRKSNLIDAIPRNSITDVYNHNDSAAIVSNTVYLKSLDNKNRTCYKKTNGQYVTKSGKIIPTGNNLPYAKTCSTASYSGNYINLDNRTEATQWTDAPNGAGARIGSKNYVHKLYSGKDFWTNNGGGDGQRYATEIFTRGSRSQFPNVTHSLTALSKQLGNQPRYTTNGVTSSIDNSFKQWFYATSGTRTNNLLDAWQSSNPYADATAKSIGYAIIKDTSYYPASIKNDKKIYKWNGVFWTTLDNSLHTAYNSSTLGLPVNAIFGTEIFDDKIVASYGSLGANTIYVDNNGVASSFNLKGYHKYCYIYNVANPNNAACSVAYNTTNKMDNNYPYRVWKRSGVKYLPGWRYLYSGCTMEYAPGFSTNYSTVPSCTDGTSNTWYK